MPKINPCYVSGCPGKRGWQKPTPLPFFNVPTIIGEKNKKFGGFGQEERRNKIIELSKKRRTAWLKAINRENARDSQCVRICARHFLSGRPAYLEDEDNPDWIPSLNLGNKTSNIRKMKSAMKKYKDKKSKAKRLEAVKVYGGSSDAPVFFEAEGYEEVLVPKTDESNAEDDDFTDVESSTNANDDITENGESPDETLEDDAHSTNNTSIEKNGHWHVHFCTKKACLFSKTAAKYYSTETLDEKD